MLRVRRPLALVLPLGALCALAAAAPASAQSADAACLVEGWLWMEPPMRIAGGQSNYTFSTGLAFPCAVTVGGQFDVEHLHVESQGFYLNDVCGTGRVQSTDAQNTVNTATSQGLPATTDLTQHWLDPAAVPYIGNKLGYLIEFVGFQGVLRFTNPNAEGGGAITLRPDPLSGEPDLLNNVCATLFRVQGAVAGTWR